MTNRTRLKTSAGIHEESDIRSRYKKEVKITKILLKISHKKAPLREAQPKQNLKIKKKKGNKRNDKKRPGKKKRFFTITT